MALDLSSIRVMLASQIAQAVKQLAAQANMIKQSMMPMLAQVGISDVKVKLRQEGTALQIVLEFDFTTEKLAKKFYEIVSKQVK